MSPPAAMNLHGWGVEGLEHDLNHGFSMSSSCDNTMLNRIFQKSRFALALDFITNVAVLQVYACLLANEIGLKQYLGQRKRLLPTVMVLPSRSSQVFSLSELSDASLFLYQSPERCSRASPWHHCSESVAMLCKDLHEILCEVLASER